MTTQTMLTPDDQVLMKRALWTMWFRGFGWGVFCTAALVWLF